MKRSTLLITLGFVIVLIVAAGLVFYFRNSSELNGIRVHIESEYDDAFALISKHAHDPDLDKHDSFEDFERRQTIREEIADALPPHAVYWATWSSDGHHGLEGIDRRSGGEGYSTDPRPVGRDRSRLRSLYRGESVEGDPLFVYEVWLLDARKRNYRIAFYQKEIFRQIERNQTHDAEQDVADEPAAAPKTKTK
jgi:hypothetical protein